jgi:hypothetical protein
LTPRTPTPVIVALLFVSGLARSMQFTTLSTLAFADLQKTGMSGANTLFSMMQQMATGLGIALGAIALRLAGLIHADAQAATTVDFHLAFIIVGAVALLALLDFRQLPAKAADAMRHPRA